jgi:hypothetical protein
MQDNLQTDMIFATDPVVGVYAQSLVPYKQLSQTYSVRSTYEVKKRLGLGFDFAHSAAHSGIRPDLNSNNYPAFPGVSPVDFAAALALAAGPISQVNIPQAILGSTVNYHFPSGVDAGLKFNYSSYVDVINPNQTGRLRSYIAFLGKTWYPLRATAASVGGNDVCCPVSPFRGVRLVCTLTQRQEHPPKLSE